MPKRPRQPGPGAPLLAPNVAEMRALAHPLRLRMLELFAETPRTTKQVADLLGQPPTRLYHHVAALERAGLLQLRETRKNRGTTEKWYGTPAKQLGSTTLRRGKQLRGEAQAQRAVALTVLEQSKQETMAALSRSADRPFIARIVIAGSPTDVARIRARLLAVVTELQQDYKCDDDASTPAVTDRWAMTMTLAPVATPPTDRR